MTTRSASTQLPVHQTWWARKKSVPSLLRKTGRQWLMAALVGAGLGLAVVGVATLETNVAALALMALLLPFVALIVGNLQKLLLAVVILEIPIQLDKSYFYDDHAASFSALGGLNISLTTFCLLLLYALWLAELLAQPGGASNKGAPHFGSAAHLPIGLAPFVYVGATALSVAVADKPLLALFEVNLLVQALLIFVYIACRIRTVAEVRFVFTCLIVGLLIQSLLILLLAGTGKGFALGPVTARIDKGVRAAGTAGSPNTTASYFSLLLASLLGVILTRPGGWQQRLTTLTLGLGTLALLLTFSRGGWIGFVVSMSIFGLMAWRKGWLSLKQPLLLALFLAVVALVFRTALANRLFGDDGNAAQGRVPLLYLAGQMIVDHPFLGVGANNFSAAWEPYLTPDFSNEWLRLVHNKFLLVWAETGVLGLLAFLWFLLATLRRGWLVFRQNHPVLSPIALGLAAGICGQMAHMQVDIFTGRPQVQLLWLVAGLVTALSRIDIYRHDSKNYQVA